MAGTSDINDTRGMWIALGGYTVLFVGKLAAFFITHLGVMFAEAMHTTADMLIAVFLLVAANIASKPADDDHRFGHGRAQNIAALVAATIFISFTSFETLRESIPKLFAAPEGAHPGTPIAMAVIVISMAVSAIPLFTILRQRTRGAATKAQLVDIVNDEIALVAALVGILFVARGFPMADPIASIIVALIIAYNAVNLWRENAAVLMGASPEPAFYDRVTAISMAVPGVRRVQRMDAEQIGPHVNLGMHIEVERGIAIEEADAIADAVHDALCEAFVDIWVVVHADPERASSPATDAAAATAG